MIFALWNRSEECNDGFRCNRNGSEQVSRRNVDTRNGRCLGVGFYDLLTLVRVYRTRCDGHAAPSVENAATFASERPTETHTSDRPIDRSRFSPLRLVFRFFYHLGSLDHRHRPIFIVAGSTILNLLS